MTSTEKTRPFFFVHVMKTGGGTFRAHVNANFRAEERYPEIQHDEDDIYMAKLSVSRLLSLPRERQEAIRIYTGHFPLAAATMLQRDLTTLTILRDPVDRTISHLQQQQRLYAPEVTARVLARLRDESEDAERRARLSEEERKNVDLIATAASNHQPGEPPRSLEEIYEDPNVNPKLIGNHQVRMFAFTPEDHMENFAEVIDIDDRRLTLAQEQLASVDLIGLQDHYEEFLAELKHRYKWKIASIDKVNASPRADVSAAFRRRIAADNAADVAFFEYARELWAKRRPRAL
jgi:hypothetical protein